MDVVKEAKKIDSPAYMLDDEDKDIIAYIAGFIIHRGKFEPSCYGENILEALEDPSNHSGIPSKLIDAKSRGGLCYPSITFYQLLSECEEVIRAVPGSV